MHTLQRPLPRLTITIPIAQSSDVSHRLEEWVPMGMSATVFDPQAQSWQQIKSSGVQRHRHRKVAHSMGWRMAAACATPTLPCESFTLF